MLTQWNGMFMEGGYSRMRKRKLGLAGLILLLILTGCGNPAQETVSSAENDEPEETKQESEGEEENGSEIGRAHV